MIKRVKSEIPWVFFAIIGFVGNWVYWGDEFFRPAITTYHDETKTTNERGNPKTYFAPV